MRFLFLFSDTGGGHRASAQAVRNELNRLYGDAAQVEMVDFFKALGRWPFTHIPGWYPAMVGMHGVPWGVGYHLTDRKDLVKALSHLMWPYTAHPFRRVLYQNPADVIVSFHGVPNYALRMARNKYIQKTVPTMVVALDLVTVHAAWFAPGHDLYVVPTDEARERALACGIASEQVKVVGMPARRAFVVAKDLPQSEARTQLGLPLEEPMVLLVGGGEGMGPLKSVVCALAEKFPKAQLVVITGRNQALYEQLCQARLPVPLRVESFVSNMEVWMRAADILVTKAGPNTLAEAFIAGLPLVLYDAIPGQEDGNVSYVVDHGAGVWAPHPDQSAEAVMALLADSARRREMAACSRALARPDAAELIARDIWQLGLESWSTLGGDLSQYYGKDSTLFPFF